MKTKPTTSI